MRCEASDGRGLDWERVPEWLGRNMPSTLAALDDLLQENPDSFPTAPGLPRVYVPHPKASGPGPSRVLLVAGSCYGSMLDARYAPGGCVSSDGRTSEQRMQGRTSSPPADDFAAWLVRDPNGGMPALSFQMPSRTPSFRRDGRGLLGRPSFAVTAWIGNWGVRGLSDPEIAHMLQAAARLREAGQSCADYFKALSAELARLASARQSAGGRFPR